MREESIAQFRDRWEALRSPSTFAERMEKKSLSALAADVPEFAAIVAESSSDREAAPHAAGRETQEDAMFDSARAHEDATAIAAENAPLEYDGLRSAFIDGFVEGRRTAFSESALEAGAEAIGRCEMEFDYPRADGAEAYCACGKWISEPSDDPKGFRADELNAAKHAFALHLARRMFAAAQGTSERGAR